ncbi:MAG TPA: D-alanyl-D-alanine carboxypeptidase/D-alanyl-D-alanine-endopeptidase [Baekduia sp.]|nr:D-alanyl-D-alanine carboxypeptidase/D-alanyl-D-alanine-endopeptidase [Baekduia sp.]
MLRRLPPLLAAVVAVVLVAAAPASALRPKGLRTHLAHLQTQLGSWSGALVVDAGSGRVLYRHRPGLDLAPASNEKLFVTASALLRFGADATLATSVVAAPTTELDDRGVVHGNLYLVGGGDPTLGDDGLATLADQLAARGVRRVDGAIVGDDSLFDTRRGGPSTGYGRDINLGGLITALSWAHGRSDAGGPAHAAAHRLAALLRRRHHIRARRKARRGALRPETAALAQQLATIPSPSMASLIALTNTPSENFYAEMLAKALGASFGTGGTTAAGLAVVRRTLSPLGVRPHLIDGSGLSHANRTSARQVVTLLRRMDDPDTAAAWDASLAVAGRTGTLRLRMRGTPAQDRCRGKTGTLIGVSALSGYCTTAGGRHVVFSFLENRVCNWCAKGVEDDMVATIARLSR